MNFNDAFCTYLFGEKPINDWLRLERNMFSNNHLFVLMLLFATAATEYAIELFFSKYGFQFAEPEFVCN